MNSENFHEYLKNPSKLHQINYQELKSLTLQYPYSPNLRFLLLAKSIIDKHKDQERNLTKASIYSPDRDKLRKLVFQYSKLQEMPENYVLKEDFLELRDLSSIKDGGENTLAGAPAAKAMEAEQPKEEGLTSIKPDELLTNFDSSGFLEDQDGLDFLEDLPEDETLLGGMPAPELEMSKPSGELHLGESASGHAKGAMEENAAEEFHSEELEAEMPTFAADSSSDIKIVPEQTQAEQEEPMVGNEPGNVSPVQAAPPHPGDEPSEFSSENAGDASQDENLDLVTGNELPELLPESVQDASQEETSKAAKEEISAEISDQAQASPMEPIPLPKKDFSGWKATFQAPQPLQHGKEHKEEKTVKKKKSPKKASKRDPADKIAEQSIQEDNEIVSETLALVLSMQGHYEKAISMYERLCLQYPEKSSLFAAKIEILKNKMT